MKIQWRDIESFVKKPSPSARVILVYGPDNGLMRERAKSMALSVVKDINDPFNAVTLSSSILTDDPARLSDEASAMSMMGGDRLVRIEDAGDKITALIKDYLKAPSPSALIILEAGELTTKSSLRKLCETHKEAAAVACYVEDERDLSRLIRETMQAANLRIDNDATAWLAANISGNRLKVRAELDKLVTYKGNEQTPITITDVQSACGESGARSLDDLIFSVGGRQAQKALQVYNQLQEEGVPFVVVIRALQNHFRRLHFAKARMAEGDEAGTIMKQLNPPVFFKYEGIFGAQINSWSVPALDRVMAKLADVEASCKKTGAPVDTLCAQAVLGISSMKA